MKKWEKLESKHLKMFGYYFPTPFGVIKGNVEEVNKFIELLEKSISEKKDYLIGHYGITEEYIKQQKRPAENIIWD